MLNSIKAKNKCIDCQDRYPGCHDHCEDFKAWRAMYDEESGKILEARKKYFEEEGISIQNHIRHKTYGVGGKRKNTK